MAKSPAIRTAHFCADAPAITGRFKKKKIECHIASVLYALSDPPRAVGAQTRPISQDPRCASFVPVPTAHAAVPRLK